MFGDYTISFYPYFLFFSIVHSIGMIHKLFTFSASYETLSFLHSSAISKMWSTFLQISTCTYDGQGGLACCNSWGRKESDTTEWLNWTELTVPSIPALWRVFLNHKRMLNFVKGFLCIYWYNHMVFIFQFVNVVYYIDWFADIEEFLHPLDKAHLVMMYDLFNMVLDSVC